MQWTKPDFQEISLGGELTAYVNTDDVARPAAASPTGLESQASAGASADASS